MEPAQHQAMTELALEARMASQEATPRLLQLLDSPEFRAALRQCCSESGIAVWPAERLLADLRANVETAELMHNLEDGRSGATLELLLNNALQYIPTVWQLGDLGYLGPTPWRTYGHPASPTAAAEEGIFRLQPFPGVNRTPTNFAEASSRLIYVALNLFRVDTGNPFFGAVGAVLSPSYWTDAVAAAAVDTGDFTVKCNRTYRYTKGAVSLPFVDQLPLTCYAGVPTPGVAGAMDHTILNYHMMWLARNPVASLFSRWHGRNETFTNLSNNLIFNNYIESNVLANVLFKERGVKLFVGSFPRLFGSRVGRLLQVLAARLGVALAWALGDGCGAPGFSQKQCPWDIRWRGGARLLDLVTNAPDLLNVTASSVAKETFANLWDEAEAARGGPQGNLTAAQAEALWARAELQLPASARVRVPAPGECSDWVACLGATLSGSCACYRMPAGGAAAVVV